jgi:hypothetical protein
MSSFLIRRLVPLPPLSLIFIIIMSGIMTVMRFLVTAGKMRTNSRNRGKGSMSSAV